MRNFYPREETGVGGIQTGCKQSGKIGIRQDPLHSGTERNGLHLLRKNEFPSE